MERKPSAFDTLRELIQKSCTDLLQKKKGGK